LFLGIYKLINLFVVSSLIRSEIKNRGDLVFLKIEMYISD